MHRTPAKTADKPKCNQIQKATDKALCPKFRVSVRSCLMLHFFLCNTLKTSIRRQNRNISVHIAIDIYGLYNLFFIGFQTAVEIVQIHSRNLSRRCIEELGRQVFSHHIIKSFLFPARHNVIISIDYHIVQLWNFLWKVL